VNQEKDGDQVQAVSDEADRSPANTFASLLSPQTYKVAAVTFANGGDNIGIYVPLFASSDLTSLGNP